MRKPIFRSSVSMTTVLLRKWYATSLWEWYLKTIPSRDAPARSNWHSASLSMTRSGRLNMISRNSLLSNKIGQSIFRIPGSCGHGKRLLEQTTVATCFEVSAALSQPFTRHLPRLPHRITRGLKGAGMGVPGASLEKFPNYPSGASRVHRSKK